MLTLRTLVPGFLIISLLLAAPARAQDARESVNADVNAKIKEEGQKRSQVMDTISFLTDVHGPRLTGSPQIRKAGEWTKGRLTDWGLANVHLEPWGPFGRGWELEGFTANMVQPMFTPLIAFPKAWSPSTPQPVRGKPIYLDVANEKDLDQFRGKLHRAIVLFSPPREVKPLFDAPAKRNSDAVLLALSNGDAAALRAARSSSASSTSAPPPSGGPTPSFNASPEQRAEMALASRKWQLVYEEGAAVVVEPGRGDGGTVFVSSATLPRGAAPENAASGPNREAAADNNPYSRGPRPWAKDSPPIVPQVVLSVEHYNRLMRMMKKGTPVELEIDIASRYLTDDLNSFNVIAEIPGSDLADQVVMLGGHFDSWHSGTGATDNAVGCGVALEAIRILQSIGVKPRRTIRLALWTGEEQGLLGSRAYVTEHFGRAITPPSGGRGGRGGSSGSSNNGKSAANGETAKAQPGKSSSSRPPTKYELKPAHEKFCAYFNLDNGTGKVRGIYLQGNEAVRPIFRSWLAPFADMGALTITPNNTSGTDHLSFDGVGLPGFQFIQDPLEYDSRTHHSNMDVYDRVQEDDMKQASIIMASFVYHAAMRDEKLPRKALLGEVIKATDKPQQ